jgi:chromosome segregation ATPase
LKKAAGEARTKLRSTRAELSALQDQQSSRYLEIYASIESGLKQQYAEAQRLVDQKRTLEATASGLEATIRERNRKIAQLDAAIDKLQARERDLQGRLNVLRQGFQQLEDDRRPA